MTVAAHGGDIYQNQITYDFSVNTNPLPLPEILQKRMAEAAVHSNRYPQYDNVLLRERLAALYGFSTEEVVCGNGASELFVAIVHALRPKRVGILAPSFSGYAWAAQTVGAEVCSIPLQEENNFAMDMAQMESLCRHLDGISLLFLANPANPAGNKMEASLLETLLDVCEKKQITVVLDECFIAFTGTEGYVSWIRKYPHLIVVRAYTKIYAIPSLASVFCGNGNDISQCIAIFIYGLLDIVNRIVISCICNHFVCGIRIILLLVEPRGIRKHCLIRFFFGLLVGFVNRSLCNSIYRS